MNSESLVATSLAIDYEPTLTDRNSAIITSKLRS